MLLFLYYARYCVVWTLTVNAIVKLLSDCHVASPILNSTPSIHSHQYRSLLAAELFGVR